MGQVLGISDEELDRIQRSEATPFKCKAKMLKTWIDGNPTASWSKIAAALEKIDRFELAAVLRNQLGITADSVSSSSGYSSAESSLSLHKVVKEDLDETDGVKHAPQNMVRESL